METPPFFSNFAKFLIGIGNFSVVTGYYWWGGGVVYLLYGCSPQM